MFDNVLVSFRLRTLYTFNCKKVVGNPENPQKNFKKTVDDGVDGWYSIFTMKFKMFVHSDNGNKILVGSSNNFSDFQNLIEEFEKFETQWSLTENGSIVFGSCVDNTLC